ncbi:DNA-binding transcriptional activator EvgA [compost metagenome]
MLGKDNREISAHLALSDKTISGYRQKIYNKFGIRSLAQLYTIMNDKGHLSANLPLHQNN